MTAIRIFIARKYYLVDIGYSHMKGYMRPYKRERYHLPDFVVEPNRGVCMKFLIMYIHHLDALLKEHLEFEKIS